MARCNKRGRSWRGSCNEKGYAGKERVATRKEYAGGVATRRDMLEKSVLQRERNTLEELQREGIRWKRACCNEKGIRWRRSCNEKGFAGGGELQRLGEGIHWKRACCNEKGIC